MRNETIHTSVRDGRPVLLKRCAPVEDGGCAQVKVCSEVKSESEFYFHYRPLRDGGQVACFHRRCIHCTRRRAKARYYADHEANKAEIRAAHRRHRQDPEWVAANRTRASEAAKRRRRNMTPERKAEYNRKRNENAKRWRDRKLAEDPHYFDDDRVTQRRVERERQRKRERMDRLQQPRVEPELFRRYLQAYQDDVGIEDGAQLAYELGIGPRLVTAVLEGERDHVAFDIVDRAVSNAMHPVDVAVNGDPNAITTVFEVGDLYDVSALYDRAA